jgi:hypothetical protein
MLQAKTEKATKNAKQGEESKSDDGSDEGRLRPTREDASRRNVSSPRFETRAKLSTNTGQGRTMKLSYRTGAA